MNIWKSGIKVAINSTPRNNAGAYSLEEKELFILHHCQGKPSICT